MTTREWLNQEFEEVVVAEGYDDAILGVAVGCGRPDTVIYDIEKCIAILVAQGMSEDDAREWLDFNVIGAYCKGAPLFLIRPWEGDED